MRFAINWSTAILKKQGLPTAMSGQSTGLPRLLTIDCHLLGSDSPLGESTLFN